MKKVRKNLVIMFVVIAMCFSLITIPVFAAETHVNPTVTSINTEIFSTPTYILNKNGTIPANYGSFQITFNCPKSTTYTVTASAGSLNGTNSVALFLQDSNNNFKISNVNLNGNTYQTRITLPVGTCKVTFLVLGGDSAHYVISVRQTFDS